MGQHISEEQVPLLLFIAYMMAKLKNVLPSSHLEKVIMNGCGHHQNGTLARKDFLKTQNLFQMISNIDL